MRQLRIMAITVLLVCVLLADSFAVDATTAWDQVCGDYSFPTVANATLNGSFATEYFGSDFESDFPLALAATAELMYTPMPPFEGDESLRASIENWPDS